MSIKFSSEMDKLLMREVSSVNPYMFSRKSVLKMEPDDKPWTRIARNLIQTGLFHAKLTGRSCQDHTKLLIQRYKAEDLNAFNKSGNDDEIVDEHTSLAADIVGLIEAGVEDVVDDKENERQRADDIRKSALETLAESKKRKSDECGGGSSLKRSSKKEVLTYLKEKHEAERAQKQEELELKKQELDLEKRRLALMEQREQASAEERRAFIRLLSQKFN